MSMFQSSRRHFLTKIAGTSVGAVFLGGLFGHHKASAADRGASKSRSIDTNTVSQANRYFDEFLPIDHDPQSDDASFAFQHAAKWSAQNNRAVVVRGHYLFSNAVEIRNDGATIIFEAAHIRIRDDGMQKDTRFGKRVPIGIFVTADNVSLLGNCTFEGLGIPGKTFLHGLYFEELKHLTIGQLTLKNMAVGLHFMCCDYVNCGDTIAHSMWGLQVTSSGSTGAGSAQAISGCRWSRFGKLQSFENDKPARYLAVGKLGNGQSRDNVSNHYGFANVTARKGSPWAQVTGIRSSVNSSFEGGHGEGVAFLLNCQKYDTDNDYSIDGNDFGRWTGEVIDTPGSVDAAAQFFVTENATPIGKNRVSLIQAKCPIPDYDIIQKLGFGMPQTFGLYCSSGDLEIGSLDFDGFTFHIHAADARLNIGSMSSKNAGYQLFRYGRGLEGSLGSLRILSDLSGYARNPGLIRPVSTGNSKEPPHFRIAEIDCSGVNGRVNAKYLVYDNLFKINSMEVGSVRGSCTSGHGNWRGEKIQYHGNLLSFSEPPRGNWSDGRIAINETPKSGQPAGWIQRDGQWWSFGTLD